jgi:hypothetical protein
VLRLWWLRLLLLCTLLVRCWRLRSSILVRLLHMLLLLLLRWRQHLCSAAVGHSGRQQRQCC